MLFSSPPAAFWAPLPRTERPAQGEGRVSLRGRRLATSQAHQEAWQQQQLVQELRKEGQADQHALGTAGGGK